MMKFLGLTIYRIEAVLIYQCYSNLAISDILFALV